jgi:broad specificity phosphatase PhoE
VGFEDDASLLARVLPALDAVAARLGSDACALVVTHVGVIRTVEGRVGERSPAIPNLGGRWFDVTDDGLHLGEPELLLDPGTDTVTTPTSL